MTAGRVILPLLDVAIVCAIPLEPEDWLGRSHSSPCGDFVRSFAAAKFDGDYDKAWSYFKSEAAFVSKRLELFVSWGALIYRKATTKNLNEASSLRKDVVVIAHWKGEGVVGDDVRQPDQVHEAARSMGLDVPALGANGKASATDVTKTLDDYVAGALCWTQEGRPTTDSILSSIARRERLNNIPGLVSGNRVELWDAMLSREDFASLLDRDQLRTLYLAICTSNYLLETTRRVNPAAICLGGRDTVRADLTLLKLTAALNLCRLEKKPLWQCLAMAGEMFDQMGKK